METGMDTLKKPTSVKLVVALLWASVLISLLTTITDPQTSQSLKAHTGVYIFSFIIVFIFAALLISKIGAGRNWARILFVLLAVFSAILFLYSYQFSEDIELTDQQIAKGVFNNALALFISTLLFSKSVSPWFHQKKANTLPASTDEEESSAHSSD